MDDILIYIHSKLHMNEGGQSTKNTFWCLKVNRWNMCSIFSGMKQKMFMAKSIMIGCIQHHYPNFHSLDSYIYLKWANSTHWLLHRRGVIEGKISRIWKDIAAWVSKDTPQTEGRHILRMKFLCLPLLLFLINSCLASRKRSSLFEHPYPYSYCLICWFCFLNMRYKHKTDLSRAKTALMDFDWRQECASNYWGRPAPQLKLLPSNSFIQV